MTSTSETQNSAPTMNDRMPSATAVTSIRAEGTAVDSQLSSKPVSTTFVESASYRAKRLVDLGLVILLSPFWFPLVMILGLAVKLSSEGAMFFGQPRVGSGGKVFRCWKLRSMAHDAEDRLAEYLAGNDEAQREWNIDRKLKNDPRVTLVGNFIRKTSLDEVPQLFNVLRGEMSLVGPRPVPVNEMSKYQETAGESGWSSYCAGRPGITGLWQINGRNNTPYEIRIELDKAYRKRCSLSLDLFILFRTVKTVLLQEGAY